MKPTPELIHYSHGTRWYFAIEDLPATMQPGKGAKLPKGTRYSECGGCIYFSGGHTRATTCSVANKIFDFLNTDILKCQVRYDKQGEATIFFEPDAYPYGQCWCEAESHCDYHVDYMYKCKHIPEVEALALIAKYEQHYNVSDYSERNVKLRLMRKFSR